MSYIIDQKDNYLFRSFPLNGRKRRQQTNTSHFDTQHALGSEEFLKKCLEKLTPYPIFINQNSDFLRVRLAIQKAFKNMLGLLCVNLDKKTWLFNFSMKIISYNDKYLQIQGKERKKLVCKLLGNRIFHQLLKQHNFSISIASGQIIIKSPAYHSFTGFNSNYLNSFVKFSLKNFLQILKIVQEPLSAVLEISNLPGHLFNDERKSRLERKKVSSLHNNSKFVNIAVQLCMQNQEGELSLVEKLKLQKQSIEHIKKQYIKFDKAYASANLFSDYTSATSQSDQLQGLEISGSVRERIQKIVQLPFLERSNNPNENVYVLNYIKINQQMSKFPGRKINHGGFTNIYLNVLEYFYIGSSQVGPETVPLNLTNPPLLKKYLVIKKEDSNQQSKGKINHEKFILKQIKNGVSMFLPKYYLLTEDDQNPKQNILLLDYIDRPNLQEYLVNQAETISLHTKIYFAIMIAQSLRYLKTYKISHLDIKPTNIMTTNRLTIKLIDFGESYHPDLTKHHPGFSMPYSAPQNYNEIGNFTHKNDVFSLGIIMYEMFIGKYPFFIYSEKLKKKIYQQGNFYDYWFNVPEQNERCGEAVVFPILQFLIIKCLNPDPKQRPELQWLVYIMRECLDYFY